MTGILPGVGVKKDSGVDEDLVRIDLDIIPPGKGSKTKGIHFNAKKQRRTDEKLAAIVTPTMEWTVQQRQEEYERILKGLEGKSAQEIWRLWGGAERLFVEGEEQEEEGEE